MEMYNLYTNRIIHQNNWFKIPYIFSENKLQNRGLTKNRSSDLFILNFNELVN